MSRRRQPPHDLEAERSVLASCLLEPDAFDMVVDHLSAGDFYAQRHATVWQTIATLRTREVAVDATTLRGALADAGALERAGGEDAVLALTDTIPTVAHVEDHAIRVRDLAMVRRMMAETARIAGEGYDVVDARGYLEAAEASVFAAASDRAVEGGPVIAREAVTETYDELRIARESGTSIKGLPTGIDGLDRKIAGLKPGELVVVGARPAMGKSALARGIAARSAEQGDPALVFSLEMTRKQWMQRDIAALSRVSGTRIRTAELDDGEWERVTRAAGTISEWPLFIDETPGLSVLQMRSRARRIRARHGLALVAVDYLQLASAVAQTDSREQQIGEVSRGLKALAKELEVPVLALSQLNRGLETRRDKRPTLADLRESGQVEQDADVVLFVYRDEVYHPDNPSTQGVAELIVGKQRSGPVGTVRTRFFGDISRFDNLAEHDDPDPPAPDDPRDFQDDEQTELWGKEAAAQ